jgi:dienelactone hydrolase
MRLRLLMVAFLLVPGAAEAADSINHKAIADFLVGRFHWTATPALIAPADRPSDPCYGIKDPTVVRFDGRWHLFATIRSRKRLRQIEYCSFTEWQAAGKGTRHILPLGERDVAAPQVLFYKPHRKWYLIYQQIDNKRRPNHYPVYSTTTDLSDPTSWSKPVELYPRTPENVKEWIDFWIICDETRAHLFFTSLDRRMWRAETKRADFPAKWSKPVVVLKGDVFEASHTYRLVGLDKYLTIIEALDGTDSATGRRYYKAYLADKLDGAWKPLAATKEKPFAGPANVTRKGGSWTDSFSHGELLRTGHDELLEVDPAHLRFLFQGVSDAARKGKPYGEIPWKLGLLEPVAAEENKPGLDSAFFIKPGEVKRGLERPTGERRLAFSKHKGSFDDWHKRAKEKLTELLGVRAVKPKRVREMRRTVHQNVRITALVMDINDQLSIPAYLLVPRDHKPNGVAALAIHGHGDIEPCIGQRDEYHRQFALELAKAGYLVLCPEIRGFGTLNDMAGDRPGYRLDYWNQAKRVNDRQFTLVTDALIKGNTLVGETVEDLLRWEEWLAQKHGIKSIKVTGLSYGGDLALTYPVFSKRVERIFASGTFGSFSPIFERCYNAPAHCIPGVLRWLDRADIAGLNAPRPIALHFGEKDTPSRDNYSASYNETVRPAFAELKQIYAAVKAADRVRLLVSKGKGHEMDVPALLAFFR